MRAKFKPVILTVASILFWLTVWFIVSYFVDLVFVIPTPIQTAKAFAKILISVDFYKTVSLSLLRVIIGFLLGVLIGVSLGVISHFNEPTRYIITPIMSVIKSTPVASVIILIWFFIGATKVPSFISLIMVAPIVWENTLAGLRSTDKELLELSKVFKFRRIKQIRYIYLPSVTSYTFPAIVTSSGLAWKSGIAAEIICYTKDSIGKSIKDNRIEDGPAMIAWTLTVIALSLIIEFGMKYLLRRLRSNEASNKQA